MESKKRAFSLVFFDSSRDRFVAGPPDLFAGMLEAIPDPVMVFTSDGHVVWANKQADTAFKTTRIGASCREVFASLDAPDSEKVAMLVSETGLDGQPRENRKIGTNSKRYWVSARRVEAGLAEARLVILVARDISWQCLSCPEKDEELHRSRARYRALAEDQGEMICHSSPAGIIHFVNEAFCRYFSQTRDDLVGSQFFPVVYPEDESLLEAHLLALTPENPVGRVVHRVIMPDGSVRWHQWTDRGIFDKTGTLVEFHSVGRDVTTRQTLSQELRVCKNQLQVLTDHTPAFVWTFNQALELTSISGRRFKNLDPDEFVGRTPQDILATDDATHPLVQAHREALDGIKSTYEVPIAKWIFVIHIEPLRADSGRIVGGMGVGLDVSRVHRVKQELKESQERFQAIFSRAPVAMFYFDAEGNLMEANQAAVELFGIKHPEAMTGLNILTDPVLEPSMRERLLAGRDLVFSGVFDFDEFQQRGFLQSTRAGRAWFEVTFTPLWTSDVRDKHVVGYLGQVTEIPKTQAAQ